MTNPTPEAIAAYAVSDDMLKGRIPSSELGRAAKSLEFIRDAIHRDGPDADAIRETLGLSVDSDDDGRRPHQFPRSAIGEDVLAWACVACGTVVREYGSGASGECLVNWRYPVERRRVVGEWREVQS